MKEKSTVRCRYWIISSPMKKRLGETETWFYRSMRRIFFKKENENKSSLIFRINFIGHILRKECLENLAPTGHINVKRDRENQ